MQNVFVTQILRHQIAGFIARFMRNNIKQRKICGESGDVRSDTDESWKERLPQMVEDYKLDDIRNGDETGCLLRAIPDKGLGQMCKGGKKSEHKVTIAFFFWQWCGRI